MRTNPHRHPLSRDPAFGLALLATGVAIIAVVAYREEANRIQDSWSDTVIVLNSEPLWDGTFRVFARRVPLHNFPEQEVFTSEFLAGLDTAGFDTSTLDQTEWLIGLAAPDPLFQLMLESGRVPAPGTPEVLAGAFTRVDRFTIEDTEYTVVGRLTRSMPGLYFAYVIPYSESEPATVFPEDTIQGWMDPKGRARLIDEFAEEDDAALRDLELLGGNLAPAIPLHAWAITAALLLVAVGGAITHLRLFALLADRRVGPFRPVLREIRDRPFLIGLVHLVLFGPFFLMMAVSVDYPLPNMWMQQFIEHVFSEGDLSYIGAAYASGNILLASVATFVNNYFAQTVALTFLISIVFPFLGLFKNMASFAIAGLGMSPIWSGMAAIFMYHCITMTLELEAYVVASFVVCVWPIKLLRGVATGTFRVEWGESVRLLGSGLLITAFMLAGAAIFEASTLILLR